MCTFAMICRQQDNTKLEAMVHRKLVSQREKYCNLSFQLPFIINFIIYLWDSPAKKVLLFVCVHFMSLPVFSCLYTFVTTLCVVFFNSYHRHVKIYDVTSYKLVANLDYPGPILSMGIAVSRDWIMWTRWISV